MPQQFTLYPDQTASENVDFVASLFGMLLPRRRRRVREVLQLVELWDARSRRAGRLSGGMQRRLELACALVHEPSLLLLDEPTAGIDRPAIRIWTAPAPARRGRT
jgi:ABC-2 type transport system ATP-binding protein